MFKLLSIQITMFICITSEMQCLSIPLVILFIVTFLVKLTIVTLVHILFRTESKAVTLPKTSASPHFPDLLELDKAIYLVLESELLSEVTSVWCL